MRGGVEARMILNLAMRFGEQYVQQQRDAIFARPVDKDEAKNRLSLVFNLIKKQRNRKIGHLYRIANDFRVTPSVMEPAALDAADVVNRLRRGLDRKLKERLQHWKRLAWLVDCGVVVEHTPWIDDATEEPIPAYDEETQELLWRDNQNPDPNASIPQSQVEQMVQQGATPERFQIIEHPILTGDVGSEIISPLNFFIDAATLTIEDLGPDEGCYIAQVKTVDWIGEVFGSDAASQIQSSVGKDLGIVRTRLMDRGGFTVANYNMRDLLPAIQGSQGSDDPPLAIMLTRYSPPSKRWPHGRRSILTPHGIMLDDKDLPYDSMPLTDFHYEAPITSFWTGDFITDLVPVNKFLNKRVSQLGEAANSQIYETLLLGPSVGKDDIPSDMPGMIEDGLNEQGQAQVEVMQHQSLPVFFMQSIDFVVQQMQMIGSVDLLDHPQLPGQIRGPMVLPLMQEIVDSEDSPLYMHLAEQLANVHQQRIGRVKQYYPPIRTLHYAGRNKRDETLVFHTDRVLRGGISFTITADPGSIYPEFSALKEARLIERLSGPLAGMYTDSRTGKLDFSRIAYELRYSDDDDTDRASQMRVLAEHIIGRLWEGEPLSQTMPEIPYPFWDMNTLLDELTVAMMTTEWLESSAQVKQEFTGLYEKARQYLAAIQDAQMNAVQGQMMQGAVAQTTQQVAAKVAAQSADAAVAQIRAQGAAAASSPMGNQVTQAFSGVKAPATPMGGPGSLGVH